MFWDEMESPCDTVLHALDVAVHFSMTQGSQFDLQPCSEDMP